MWVKFIIILLILFSTEKLSAELALIYPTEVDSLECGTTINIKWINTSSKPIDIYYSLDSINWISIQRNVYEDNYDWIVPITLQSKVYFKLFRAGDSGVELIWDNKNAHTEWTQVSKFVGDDKLVTVGKEDSVKVWEISTKKLLKTLFIQNSPTNIQATNFAMEYDPDQLLVAQDKTIWTWDLTNNKLDKIYVNPDLGTARVLDFDPNNREVAVGSNTGIIKIIDLFGVEIAHFSIPSMRTIYSIDYSSDGRFLAVAGDDGYIHLINLETEEITQSKIHHGGTQNLTIWSVEISNDSKYILTGGVDNKALLWDFNTLDTIQSYPSTANIRSTRFSKDSRQYLIAGLNFRIDQYSSSTFDLNGSTINHGAQVLWAEYLNNGDTLVSAGRDGSFKVWKNSNSADVISTSSSNLYQKMEINFPELYVSLSEEFVIPIEFKGNFELLDSIKIDYLLPIDLAKIEGFDAVKSVNRDERFNKIFVKDDIITQEIHKAKSLMSNRKRGDLTISDIEFFPTGNYKINTDDGFIEIVDTCDIDTSRFVIIEKGNTKVDIVNVVENNILNYKLSSIVDSYFDISIYDINSSKVMQLQNSFFRNGNYILSADIDKLASGIYFLVTKYEDKLLSNKFIKK